MSSRLLSGPEAQTVALHVVVAVMVLLVAMHMQPVAKGHHCWCCMAALAACWRLLQAITEHIIM
jgi:hypothetical protein